MTTTRYSPSSHPNSRNTQLRLTRQHRAWIALYALDANARPRADVLSINQVTEADLAEFEESWLRLRCQPTTVTVSLPARFTRTVTAPPTAVTQSATTVSWSRGY